MALHGASIFNYLHARNRRVSGVPWNATLNFDLCRLPVEYLKYQSYFLQGLESLDYVKVSMRPAFCSFLAKLNRLKVRGVNRLWTKLQEIEHPESRTETNYVGRYFLKKTGQQPVRIAIDASDGRDICDQDTLEWCDFFFKTNRWAGLTYPPKVYPLMNANGLLTRDSVDQLRSLRGLSKTVDLAYWTKIWEPDTIGGYYSRKDCTNIVEHQIRLFEAFSMSACNKDMIAILPESLHSMDISSCIKRLEACGVRCQRSWGDIGTQKFWRRLASARLVPLRSGNHLCISWRMTDLLAMGACIVCDGSPYPVWQVPLERGVQFVDGQCNIRPDFSLPPDSHYDRLTNIINELLADETRQHRMRQQAAWYFDTHCEPETLASYILNTVEYR